MEILELVIGLVVGLFGGVGAERYRYARKDHEHRQGYYHRLIGAIDAYTEAADEIAASDPDDAAIYEGQSGESDANYLARLRAGITDERQGIEVFGALDVANAAKEAERAISADDQEAREPARERLVTAMRRDVAPRRFLVGPRR